VNLSEFSEPRLHPLVRGFSDAEVYEKGRPVYGEAVVAALIEGLGLASGAPVLDLGAGAGALARPLLEAGLDVTAVEPLEQMRTVLGRAIGSERVRAGVAEEIPLGRGSVEAALAADSFHWFDERRALSEIRRVLRPGGGVAILRTYPVLDAPWGHELGSLIADSRPDHPAFVSRGAAAALEEDPAFGPVTETEITSEHASDRERTLAYVASLSWVGSLPADRLERLLADADAVLRRHGVEEVRHQMLHQIWIARLRPET
jgi:SAM-dependent methyltransferase